MAKAKGDSSAAKLDLGLLSKDDLIEKVRQLEAHVVQLKNLLHKAQNEKTGRQKPEKNKPFDFTKYNTRHVALKVAYLGWDYQGFAVQEDSEKTIEAALFAALHRIKLIESRETSNYHRCGRTDKGVSALSQVISIDLRTNLLEGKGVKIRENGTAAERDGDKETEIPYVFILNKVLPPEIRVLAWCPVETDFSARFSCLKRTYKYIFPKGTLDIERMKGAARLLEGEHDYRNFCKMDVGNGVVNFMRKIMSTDIQLIESSEKNSGGYEMCELTVVGQAFLWHQIRCIVAVLCLVGQGLEDERVIEELLDVKTNPRKPQYSMASEIPLVLFDCQFEDVSWQCDQNWQEQVLKHMQEMWAQNAVKSTMLKRMLEDMDHSYSIINQEETPPVINQMSWLIPGNKPRTYIPLMQREKCENLEKRIERFAKRRKITHEEDGEGDACNTEMTS